MKLVILKCFDNCNSKNKFQFVIKKNRAVSLIIVLEIIEKESASLGINDSVLYKKKRFFLLF